MNEIRNKGQNQSDINYTNQLKIMRAIKFGWCLFDAFKREIIIIIHKTILHVVDNT